MHAPFWVADMDETILGGDFAKLCIDLTALYLTTG
jgi:hypothetical protein